MGSDLHMNPPKAVWESHEFEDEDDAFVAISVAIGHGWVAKIRKGDDKYLVWIHKGEYV